MATAFELGGFYSQLKSLLRLHAQALSLFSRLKHTLAGEGMKVQSRVVKGSKLRLFPGQIEISGWQKVDARTFGVERSMIPVSSWLVLKLLREKGFQAYLVGGCVRDLLLKRIPKDFDVITTANLKQIHTTFHHAHIVGRRFPICRVYIKGSIVEVSSFETAASHGEEGAKTQFPKVPRGCNKMDYIRWRDSMRRDFTINSLFYDPFSNKIYDYANGMKDLTSSKLRTLIPADVSFKEDCARILRGLRIAARLGLSFSKDAETAMYNLSFSIKALDKSRLMMELNYMFSYGAAEHSLHLLRRFNLLEILLPIQDAYLNNQYGDQAAGKSVMLTKLFSFLDQVVTCDRPCDCTLWVGLLSFHQALVASPQDALVLWAFSSMLYHGNWSKAVKIAREHALEKVDFEPEISKTFNHVSDEELVHRVSKFASTIQDSINALSDSDSLSNAMARYLSSPCSGVILVSRKASEDVARIFDVLLKHDTESHLKARESYGINYLLLGKGNLFEKRFVIGKIIMDTMSSAVLREVNSVATTIPEEKNHQANAVVGEVKSVVTTIPEEKNHQANAVVGEVKSVATKIPDEWNHQSNDERQREPVDVEEKVSADSPDKGEMVENVKKRRRIYKEECIAVENGKVDEMPSTLNLNKKTKDARQASFGISEDTLTTKHVENEHLLPPQGKEKKMRRQRDVVEKNFKIKHQEVVASDIESAPQL